MTPLSRLIIRVCRLEEIVRHHLALERCLNDIEVRQELAEIQRLTADITPAPSSPTAPPSSAPGLPSERNL